jgi:hypothetical protein
MITTVGRVLIGALCLVGLCACGIGAPPSRLGMVKDPATGLQIGSVIANPMVTDASFYPNKTLKVRVRNTSGDPAFDLRRFTDQFYAAYREAGYTPTEGDDFGVLVDVNVMYSGQVSRNLSEEYSFLGAAAGGAGGFAANEGMGTAVGVITGATLGSIVGSYITDDTYIVIANVTFGIIATPPRRDGKTITFSRSQMGSPDEEEERTERTNARGFRRTHATNVSVYAGGRNVRQSEIAGQVRERFVRIVRDII